MASDLRLTPPRDARVAAPLPGLSGTWFGGLAALLVVEGAIVALRYHWTVLAEERLGYGLGYARGLVEPALPAALATALVTALSVRGQLRRPPGDRRTHVPRWPFLLAHLAAFVAFVRAVAYLVAGDPASSPYPDARAIARLIGDPWSSPLRTYWVGAVALLGVAALALWEAAVFPPRLQWPWRWRGLAPLLVGMGIGLAAVAAGRGVEASWPALGWATLWTVHRLLTLVFPEVVYRPAEAVVGTPGFAVWIAPACSGYEGIGLVLVFVAAYLWLDRHHLRFPQSLLLLPIGAAVMWLANALRIAALVAVGAWVSPSVALQGFHAQAGWLAVNAVALGLVAVAQRARFVRAGPAAAAVGNPPPTAAYLVPLLALVAAAMLTGALCDGFDRLYPARVLAALAALAYFRRAYTGLRWSWSWAAVVQGAMVSALWVGSGSLGPGVAAGGGSPSLLAELPRAWAAAWLIGRVVGSVVVVPLVEELAFRGYLVRRLIAAKFETVPPGRLTWPSLLISSLLFGALHGRWLAGMAAGAVYALAQRRRGELGDAVLAHGTTNGLLTAYALATGDWSSWS
jgi:exosortase E/protease (VPEID-CTERM system)